MHEHRLQNRTMSIVQIHVTTVRSWDSNVGQPNASTVTNQKEHGHQIYISRPTIILPERCQPKWWISRKAFEFVMFCGFLEETTKPFKNLMFLKDFTANLGWSTDMHGGASGSVPGRRALQNGWCGRAKVDRI